jgi:hypothetical protein
MAVDKPRRDDFTGGVYDFGFRPAFDAAPDDIGNSIAFRQHVAFKSGAAGTVDDQSVLYEQPPTHFPI